jgi:co-chaperonin GroES (HSP10)
MYTNFHPRNDVVAIRPRPRGEGRQGKIIIPESAHNAEECGWIEEGVVVYAGPGDKMSDGSHAEMLVKPGDVVLYVGGRAGDWVTVNGERLYVIFCEQFVLAVLEREEQVEKVAA